MGEEDSIEKEGSRPQRYILPMADSSQPRRLTSGHLERGWKIVFDRRPEGRPSEVFPVSMSIRMGLRLNEQTTVGTDDLGLCGMPGTIRQLSVEAEKHPATFGNQRL